jgi:DNA-binding NtrC family response regulator
MAERVDVRRVLLLEDEADLRRAMARKLAARFPEVIEAGTSAEALAALERAPDLLIADLRLPDGSALPVLEAARGLRPEPLKIAISGAASAQEAFELSSRYGVLEFLAKPFSLADLEAVIDRVLTLPPPALEPMLKASVGQWSLPDMRGYVRRVMLDHALAVCAGSRTAAARLLGTTRQAVQQATRPQAKALNGSGAAPEAPAPPPRS